MAGPDDRLREIRTALPAFLPFPDFTSFNPGYVY